MNILITGYQASGKTLLLKKIQADFEAQGHEVHAFDDDITVDYEPKKSNGGAEIIKRCRGNLREHSIVTTIDPLYFTDISVFWFDIYIAIQGKFVGKMFWGMYDTKGGNK